MRHYDANKMMRQDTHNQYRYISIEQWPEMSFSSTIFVCIVLYAVGILFREKINRDDRTRKCFFCAAPYQRVRIVFGQFVKVCGKFGTNVSDLMQIENSMKPIPTPKKSC